MLEDGIVLCCFFLLFINSYSIGDFNGNKNTFPGIVKFCSNSNVLTAKT